MYSIIWILLSIQAQVTMTAPKAPKSPGYQVQGAEVVFEHVDFRVVIRPLSWQQFRALLVVKGVAPEFLEVADVQQRLQSMAAFEIELENLGDQTLSFTADQVQLGDGPRPLARLVQPLDMIPPSQSEHRPGDEALSQAIARSSRVIGNGQSARELIVFQPVLLDQQIRNRRMSIVLDQIYYGIDKFQVEASFLIGHAVSP